MKPFAAVRIRVEPPSRGTALPPFPPLRTVRTSFPVHGSSLSNVLLRTRFWSGQTKYRCGTGGRLRLSVDPRAGVDRNSGRL